MAATFREPNMARWLGVRPAHNGIQVAQGANATNQTTIIITVPANKVLLLTTATLFPSTVAAGVVYMLVRDAGDAYQYIIAHEIVVVGGAPGTTAVPFPIPLEIPAGWDVVIISSAVGLTGYGFIFGILDDA